MPPLGHPPSFRPAPWVGGRTWGRESLRSTLKDRRACKDIAECCLFEGIAAIATQAKRVEINIRSIFASPLLLSLSIYIYIYIYIRDSILRLQHYCYHIKEFVRVRVPLFATHLLHFAAPAAKRSLHALSWLGRPRAIDVVVPYCMSPLLRTMSTCSYCTFYMCCIVAHRIVAEAADRRAAAEPAVDVRGHPPPPTIHVRVVPSFQQPTFQQFTM